MLWVRPSPGAAEVRHDVHFRVVTCKGDVRWILRVDLTQQLQPGVIPVEIRWWLVNLSHPPPWPGKVQETALETSPQVRPGDPEGHQLLVEQEAEQPC